MSDPIKRGLGDVYFRPAGTDEDWQLAGFTKDWDPCGAEFGEGQVCDRPVGHDGPHGFIDPRRKDSQT
jgi:hypothetical protein